MILEKAKEYGDETVALDVCIRSLLEVHVRSIDEQHRLPSRSQFEDRAELHVNGVDSGSQFARAHDV